MNATFFQHNMKFAAVTLPTMVIPKKGFYWLMNMETGDLTVGEFSGTTMQVLEANTGWTWDRPEFHNAYRILKPATI